MSLAAGDRFSAYEILAQVGAGGMGEVYRARDTRLGRDVAIKALPDAFTSDAERVARFQREAQLLAAFNHPNIGGIYGVEEHNGSLYLVLEYVPGVTLAKRLERGAMPLDEAAAVARQIAEALAAAHEKGILHRDLKPANIKIAPDGKVKVLDFGLAKDTAVAASSSAEDATITSPAHMTRAGVILGTAAYMSPEQARGRAVDKRADIWAFGCVLYEMLSGREPFAGDTVTDVMAAIVRGEPDWDALPQDTPPRMRWLLRKCLQKEPHHRLHDIGDARLEIEDILIAAPEAATAMPSRSRFRRAAPWMFCAALAAVPVVSLWSLWRRAEAVPNPTARAVVNLPPKTNVALGRGSAVVFSPDGARVAYVATSAGGAPRLYLRALDQTDSTVMPDTEGAANPFFSPDSRWVGFFADGKLKKASVLGGAPMVLCDVANPRGESWSEDGEILFTPASNAGIFRVSASGGAPRAFTTREKGELSHRWPQALPGGKAVLFTIWNDSGFDAARIAVQSLQTGKRSILLHGGGYARYAALPGGKGYLVYARTDELLAAPFDLQRLEVTGAPVPILEGVITNLSGGAHFSFSQDGSLAYLLGSSNETERTLLWVDRKGATQEAASIVGLGQQFRLSPDGRRLLRNNPTTGGSGWMYDLDRKISTRLTTSTQSVNGAWTPDGKRVVYSAGLPTANLFWKAVDGAGPEERLTTSENNQYADCWTPDGKTLVFTELKPSGVSEIWTLSMENGRKTKPFLTSQFSQDRPDLSPDGKWLAYSSNESGRSEIYVQAFPDGGKRWQISSDIGYFPKWSKDGREVYYEKNDQMMAAAVSVTPEFHSEKPRPLFSGRFSGGFDIAPDGRFLMIKGDEQDSAPTQFNIVLNWFGELAKTVGKK